MLVDKLNGKICRDIFMNQEEEYLEVEDIRKEVDREFILDIREEDLVEIEEESESEERKYEPEDKESEEET